MIDLKTQMDEVILRLVPVGEENAMTARRIWRQMDIGTIAGVKFKLNRMVAHGLLERKHAPTFSVEASCYFRKEPSRSGVTLERAGHPHSERQSGREAG